MLCSLCSEGIAFIFQYSSSSAQILTKQIHREQQRNGHFIQSLFLTFFVFLHYFSFLSLFHPTLFFLGQKSLAVMTLVIPVCVSCSVVSDSLRLHRLQPTRLLCPWNSPCKNTGAGCPSLLQKIFLTQGLNPGLLHCRQILYHLSSEGSYNYNSSINFEVY